MPDEPPPQRVSPITVPEDDPALPSPDASQPALVRDAFREYGFACSVESPWIARSLTLQRGIVRDSTHSRYRNHRYAAALLLWSRIDAAALEAWRLIAWANYAAVPPLVRAALEWLGAEQAVVGSEFVEFQDYLRDFARHDAEHAAAEWGMGQYMAGQQLAMAPDLSAVYRAAAELSRPHFGASMLATGSGSNRQRVLVHWGDRSFHLGWAQLLSGWLMTLLGRQTRFAIGRGLFAVDAAARESFQALTRESETLLARPDRCRAEWVTRDGRQRLLISGFRRPPSGAPQRILL
ncbi:MAG: hypothetical protein OXI03_04390 [Chloroflexota bacterium]|nr:hypothetical protein [Chloroflexota bacterium]